MLFPMKYVRETESVIVRERSQLSLEITLIVMYIWKCDSRGTDERERAFKSKANEPAIAPNEYCREALSSILETCWMEQLSAK